MNPLLKRLASLRWRVRLLDGWQGVCALIALVFGVGVAVGVLDFWLHLPGLVRAVFLVGTLVTGGMVAHRFLLRPFSRRCDDLNLALRVEEAYPELNDALASTVQFLAQTKEEQARIGGSEALRERTMRETMEKAAACDFGRILDRRAAALFGAAAVCVLLVAGLAIGANRSYASIAFWRFVEPFGGHTWTTIAVARQAPHELVELQADDARWESLDPRAGKKDRIAIGRPYFIKVTLHGQIPKRARVEIEGQNRIRTDKEFELKATGRDQQSASFVTAVDMTQQYQKFRFRVLANDGTFPPRSGAWHEVEVLPPPKLIDLDGRPSPQINIYPPGYTDLPSPKRLEPGTRHLELLAGSNVVLRAKADRKLEQAWIEYRPENALVTPASALASFGQTNPLAAVAQAAGGNAVWGRVPAQFEADGATFRIEFMPSLSGGYLLYLRDFDRLERSETADLRVNLDPVPEVKLLWPATSTMTALPTANIRFKFHATDELFAVKSVWVEYQRKTPDGTPLDEPKRALLYDAAAYGKLVPFQIASALHWPRPTRDLRLRNKKLEFETVWSLRDRFKDGDVVFVEICADDFCDIYPTRIPGRSRPIELRIIGKQKMIDDAEKALADAQKKLQAAEKLQKQALDASKETMKEEKIDQKVRDNFIDRGAQPQREVHERIGKAPKEGLRGDVGQIMQTLKDSGLTDTPAYRDAKKIKGTLDAIASQEYPQIEPKLTEINNELAKNDKNTPQAKKTLEATAKLQKSALDALSQLNQKLDPNAKMRDISNKMRNVASKQQEIRKELIDINAARKDVENANKDNPELLKRDADDKRKLINQKAAEQLELHDQMNKLLDEMKAAKEEFLKKGDNEKANKIQAAIDKAQKPKAGPKQEDKLPIQTQMKDVAKALEKNNGEAPEKLLKQQENIQNGLEKMLGAIEGGSEDFTRQEMQKREQIEKDLDKVAKQLQKLREQAKKADMIKDKEERLKAKQELAKQHQDLQEQVNELRRELARLDEQRAANALNDAANDLEKAANKLKNGENPEHDQKNAKEKIQQAKREVKEAQEELARELLIKIADQIEMLMVRQIATKERSEVFQGKLMKRNMWNVGFLNTIEGNIDVQTDIGDETDALKEKLKGAKVFASILEKAKGSMDTAAKTMKDRLETATKDRQENELDKMEREDEARWHTVTVKNQKSAADRLGRILDSLKEEIAKNKKKKEERANADPMNPDQEKKEPGGMKARDGIPSTAELKALRAEQFDLNQLTEDFAKRNPDLTKLDDDQRKELRELSEEQERIHSLFQGLVAPAELKEGDPK